MDNQHATLQDTDLAYLAGIIDGEGWVGLQKVLARQRFTVYHPYLRVTNTDPNIIERVQSIWEGLGTNGHIYESGPQKPSVTNGKTVLYIQLQKQAPIKTVLEAVMPYLVGKKARAAMLLRFLNKTVDREEAFTEIKRMNKKGIDKSEQSETTREAPTQVG